MLLLSVLCLIGSAFALPVPETEDVFIQEVRPVSTISLGDEADIFDDVLLTYKLATPLITALGLAGKRSCCFEVDWDLVQKADEIISAFDPDYLASLVASQSELGEEQENLFGDILNVVETVAPLAIAVLGKRELGDEADNIFDDILKAVQVASPIVTTLAGKRYNSFLDIDPILPVLPTPIISPLLVGRDVQENLWDDIVEAVSQPMYSPSLSMLINTLGTGGEESDNLFDDILKAVQVATPIVTALAGKREVADSEWFDTFLAAVEAATPTILGVIQGAGSA